MKFFKKNFLESLDIFAQFFISPLLDKNWIDKEMKAVVSEFDNTLRSDNWREYQLFKHISKKESLLNRLSNGNYDTLKKDDIYEVLKKFHQNNYSANIMTLVIYQNKPISEIKNQVNDIFKHIKNTNIKHLNYDEFVFPFDKSNTKKLLNFKALKKEKNLKFFWFFESFIKNYKSQPLDIITHLLGHESEGSVHALLYDKNLIYSLECNYFINEGYYSEFSISLDLTEKGIKNIPQIISIISNFLNLLKKDFIPEWIFNEIKEVKEFNYRYFEKDDILDTSINVCENAVLYPVEMINQVDYLMEEYVPELYKEILLKLNLENLVLIYCDENLENLTEIEPYYKSKFSFVDIPEDYQNAFLYPDPLYLKKLHLPPKNYFVPKIFNLIPDVEKEIYPYVISNNDLEGKVFYKGDNHFKLPKLNVYYKFYSELIEESILIQSNNISLWINILKIFLSKFLYLADSAKIIFEIENKARGFEIQIEGFSDKIDIFINELSKKMKYFIEEIPIKKLEKYFNIAKKKEIIEYEDFNKKKIYKRVLKCQYNILMSNYFSVEENLSSLKKIEFSDFLRFFKNFINKFYYETIYIGNISKTHTLKLNQVFIGNLKKENYNYLDRSKIMLNRVVDLKPNIRYIFKKTLIDIKEKNDCALITFQGKNGPKEYYKMLLLEKYLETPFFEELRTEKQLGYSVFSEFVSVEGQYYFFFVIQSNVINSMKCIEHINEFIKKYSEIIKNMEDKLFNKLKKSILKSFLQPFNNLDEEITFYWGSITEKKYQMDERERVSYYLDSIKKEDLINLYQELFFKRNKVMEIHFSSQNNIKNNNELYELRRLDEKINFYEFDKQSHLQNILDLFPDIYLLNQ